MRFKSLALPIMTAGILSACASIAPPSSDIRPIQSPVGAVTPSNIYDACMSVEMKLAIEQKKKEPKVYSHFICQYYAGMCKDAPEGESCQKAILSYSAK